MDEYYALQQSDVHPGGCIPMARAMTPEEIAQQEAIRREYADRIWRQDALRAAFEMVRGTDRGDRLG
jgi:hypothetical protein